MYKRRRFTPRSSFRSRRGPMLRTPTRPKFWQRANFFAESSVLVPNSSLVTTNVAILLARHQNLARNIAEGIGAMNQVRYIELGGIVYDWGLRREAFYEEGTGSLLGTTQGHTLLVDRLDNTGLPVTAATTDWALAQPPVVQVSTTVPGAGAQDVDFPTKIIHRKWERKPHYAVEVVASEGLWAPEGQYLDQRNPTVNKRLKLRLGDADGLFAVFSVVTSASYSAGGTISWPCWIQGQLYYRVRY